MTARDDSVNYGRYIKFTFFLAKMFFNSRNFANFNQSVEMTFLWIRETERNLIKLLHFQGGSDLTN